MREHPASARHQACRHALQALALFLCNLFGCADDTCHSLRACDIRATECQEDVATWVQCVRGGSAPRPKVERISADEYRERVLALRAMQNSSTESAEAWNRGLARFRLAPEVYDPKQELQDQVDVVGAAYFPESRTVAVIDRGQRADDNAAVALLAHEFVHAAQDAELELRDYQARWGATFDSSLALKGLLEGEAVHYQLLAQIEQSGRILPSIDWERTYERWRTEELRSADADSAPVSMARLRFPYAFGGGYVTQLWLSKGRAGIDERLEHPPETTREILFGPAPVDTAPVLHELRARGRPVLGESYEDRGFATLGAWIARIYAGRVLRDVSSRVWPAKALAADVFSVQADAESGQLLSTWQISVLAPNGARMWPHAEKLQQISHWFPDSRNEVVYVSTTLGVPPRPELLEWTSVDDAEPQTDGSMDALSSHLACVAHTPEIVFK